MTKETPEQEAALLEKYAKRIKVNLRNGSYEDHIENIKTGLREYAGELGITAARMYMGEVERLKAENERLKTPEAMREAMVEYYTWRVTSGWELHSSGEYYYRSKDRHQWPPEETCELHELFQHFLNDVNKATEALKTNTQEIKEDKTPQP